MNNPDNVIEFPGAQHGIADAIAPLIAQSFQQVDPKQLEEQFIGHMRKTFAQVAQSTGVGQFIHVDHEAKTVTLDRDVPQDFLFPYLCYGLDIPLDTEYSICHNGKAVFTFQVVNTDRDGCIGYNINLKAVMNTVEIDVEIPKEAFEPQPEPTAEDTPAGDEPDEPIEEGYPVDHYAYILRCSDGSFYTGYTTNLFRRLDEHNNSNRGAKYTRSRRPVDLVYHEKFSTKSEAMKREAEIKKMTHAQKQALVDKGVQ